MDIKTTIQLMLLCLLAISVIAVIAAVFFGRQYKAGGTKKQKYLCVACSVASCVCLITAIQIWFVFRNVVFAAVFVGSMPLSLW